MHCEVFVNFYCAHISQERNPFKSAPSKVSHCLTIYIYTMYQDICAVKNIIFLLHVSKDTDNNREANPTSLFCSAVYEQY